MALSSTEICNNALIRLGKSTISSLSDNNESARVCNIQYNISRKAVLRSHPWNFAIKRIALAVNPTAPVFGFSTAFDLPADCLRVVSTSLAPLAFRVEGRLLLQDTESTSISYIRDEVLTGLFDPMFDEALAIHIAAASANSLTDNTTLADRLQALFKVKIVEARSADGMEGPTLTIDTDYWTASRRGGVSLDGGSYYGY